MGLRALANSYAERRSVDSDQGAVAWDREFPSLAAARRTFAGKRVSQSTARSMIAVYACQTLISDGIATLPVDHYRKLSKGRRELVPSSQSPRWVKQPNPFQTSVEFWTRVIASLLSDGNAFIVTLRDNDGNVVALYCLHPEAVEIIPGPLGENKYQFEGEQYDRSQILHIPAFIVGSEARGLSPIDVAREAIGLGLTVEEYGARFFAQGTTLSGIIEHPGMPAPDEAKMLRDMFRKTHAGTKNSHAVGILTGGASFKPITIEPDKAQFIESRKFQKSEIALLYRVPAYIIDPTVTSTWGSGVEEQNKFLVDYTFTPWAVRIEQAVSTFLMPGSQFLKFNFDARLRASTKDRYEAYSKAIDAGIMNLDEARALEDLPELPDGQGQVFWRPANMVPIQHAIKDPVVASVAIPEPPAASEDTNNDE